jgi:hypothetical protein
MSTHRVGRLGRDGTGEVPHHEVRRTGLAERTGSITQYAAFETAWARDSRTQCQHTGLSTWARFPYAGPTTPAPSAGGWGDEVAENRQGPQNLPAPQIQVARAEHG